MKKSLPFLFTFFIFFSTNVYANISLNKVILNFLPGGPNVDDISVTNISDMTLKINTQVIKIVNPKDEFKRVKLKNPLTAGIIASPKSLILEPKQTGKVRVVVMKPAISEDNIYYISVIPKIHQTKEEKQTKNIERNMAIKILVGYEALVIVRPTIVNNSVTISRNGNQLKFENNGKTNVLIHRINQCDAQGKNCRNLVSNRLYSKEKWTLKLPYAEGKVKFFQSLGYKHIEKEY